MARLLVVWSVLAVIAGCGGGARSEARAERPVASGGEAASSSNGNPSTASGGGTTIMIGASSGPGLSAGGLALIESGRCAEAMRDWLEPAIRAHGPDDADGVRHVAARTASGGLMAGIFATDGSTSVVVEDTAWTDTLYLEAFCLVELGRLPEARPYLERALAMAPGDVVYACELGNILATQGDFRGALSLFQAARENAYFLAASSEFAPTPAEPEGPTLFGMTMEEWTRRSMRGIGYQLIELGDLEGAEAMYREILSMEPGDTAAQNELAYIAEMRARRGY